MNELFDSLRGKTTTDLYLESAITHIEDAIQSFASLNPDMSVKANSDLAHHLQLVQGAILNLRDARAEVSESA